VDPRLRYIGCRDRWWSGLHAWWLPPAPGTPGAIKAVKARVKGCIPPAGKLYGVLVRDQEYEYETELFVMDIDDTYKYLSEAELSDIAWDAGVTIETVLNDPFLLAEFIQYQQAGRLRPTAAQLEEFNKVFGLRLRKVNRVFQSAGAALRDYLAKLGVPLHTLRMP
jgi:hypothetical protein